MQVPQTLQVFTLEIKYCQGFYNLIPLNSVKCLLGIRLEDQLFPFLGLLYSPDLFHDKSNHLPPGVVEFQ